MAQQAASLVLRRRIGRSPDGRQSEEPQGRGLIGRLFSQAKQPNEQQQRESSTNCRLPGGDGSSSTTVVARESRSRKRHLHSASSPVGAAAASAKLSSGRTWLQLVQTLALGLWCIIGVIACAGIGLGNSWLHRQLHEGDLWFTNIKEVEREISFRTESGLYYSYYKQLVAAPTLLAGLDSLIKDNITEHPSTVNILQRFNVYQEVALAALWRVLPVGLRRTITLDGRRGGSGQPILFYLYSIFSLHSLLVWSIVALAAALAASGGSKQHTAAAAWRWWPVGIVSAVLYVVHRADTTRLTHTAPLREHFALPFLWAQIACITYFFRSAAAGWSQALYKTGIFVFTLLFAICWQFNQFILLLQAAALFAVWCLKLVPARKVVPVLVFHVASTVIVCAMQFGNTMLLSSLHASFVPAALLVIYVKGESDLTKRSNIFRRVLEPVLLALLAVGLAVLARSTIKYFLVGKADEHIYKFVMTKLNYSLSTDFDVQLYLCNGAFGYLDKDFYYRMMQDGTLHLYAAFSAVSLILLLYSVLRPLAVSSTCTPGYAPQALAMAQENPELMFNLGSKIRRLILLLGRTQACEALSLTLIGLALWLVLTSLPVLFLHQFAAISQPRVLVASRLASSRFLLLLLSASCESMPLARGLFVLSLALRVQSLPFACMAAFVMRMKYLWSVYMCVFAPAAVCGRLTWQPLSRLTKMPRWLSGILRIFAAILYASLLVHTNLPSLQSDLQHEREFWDPDTVELMDWIKNSTSRGAAFAGSMQLMAGVKLCTGRPIVNHPHYEDEALRSRTWELYQMYGRKLPHEIHSTLRKYNTSYIILEDSICRIPPDGCKVPDIVDVVNGMIPRGNVRPDVPALVQSTIPRFCEEVRHGRGNYSKFFKLVMVNKTFRVYRVIA